MSTIDVDSLQSFTAAELLKLTEYRIAQILAGAQSYSSNGKQFTHADLPTLYRERDRLADEVAAADAGENGGGNVLVRIGEPQ